MPFSLRPPVRMLSGLAACMVLAGAVAACGGTTGASKDATVVRVSLRDFAIVAAPEQVPAGMVVFQIHNRGPDMHELIVVRLTGTSLPLRSDGLTVDEEALVKDTVGALEPGAAGPVRELRVRLEPGRYELICNMSGHYMGGMHVGLLVH
jgi:uncharacterized cupredoxin-like copper-binding protein